MLFKSCIVKWAAVYPGLYIWEFHRCRCKLLSSEADVCFRREQLTCVTSVINTVLWSPDSLKPRPTVAMEYCCGQVLPYRIYQDTDAVEICFPTRWFIVLNSYVHLSNKTNTDADYGQLFCWYLLKNNDPTNYNMLFIVSSKVLTQNIH